MTEWSSSRRALLIATDRYEDHKLKGLRSPVSDVEQLSQVLEDPEIASFSTTVASNETEAQLRRRISSFFASSAVEEVLLLHIACHGVKDDDGNLYFAATDTEVENLDATAVSSEWLVRQIAKSRSKRIVVFLDCCYSGAFSAGMAPRGDQGVQLKERFDGRGRVVLTASNSMEYAWEGDARSGSAEPSVFTGALVQGLKGLADRNRDGWITIDELYDYAFDHVRETAPQQSPMKVGGVEGTLYLARSPATREVKPSELPTNLRRALSDGSPFAREGAARELGRLLRGEDEGMAVAARLALEQLADDDSRRVAETATELLTEVAPTQEPHTSVIQEREEERTGSGREGIGSAERASEGQGARLDQMAMKQNLGSPAVGSTLSNFDEAAAARTVQAANEGREAGGNEIIVAEHVYGLDPWGFAERKLVVTDRRLLLMKKDTIELSISMVR
jgi:uncharacterized caspase-like protein